MRMVSLKHRQTCEFGDFQTPDRLAIWTTQVVKRLNMNPQSILEPTCGRGSFLLAAIEAFPEAQDFLGIEINQAHLDELHQRLAAKAIAPITTLPITTLQSDFFKVDWDEILNKLPQPILVLGNPPWVTNSKLGGLQSANLPRKSNFQGLRGLNALTGKSNFDISEWMLLQYLEWFRERTGTIAVLCKASVTRKILAQAWKQDYPIYTARIYKFDAMEFFGAAVEACLFVLELGQRSRSKECWVYNSLFESQASHAIGWRNGIIAANLPAYARWQHLHEADEHYTWRSGIKHDCAKVMELQKIGNAYQNGEESVVLLEEAYLYPLFKSSDVSHERVTACRKYLLVTQRSVGEDTAHLESDAPAVWQYLQDHADALAKRGSSIYRNRPPFSIFGVGSYTFAPWKVAISGFYKKLRFTVVSPIQGQPAVFDDTVYFLPCLSKDEAKFLAEILNSSIAAEFLSSMIFWSDKRPITIELLKRLSIKAIAQELGREEAYDSVIKKRSVALLNDSSSRRMV